MTNLPRPLGNYLLQTEIGQSDWATHYRGRRVDNESPLLISLVAPLFATDEIFARRFKLLTNQLAQLSHPNLVPVIETEPLAEALVMLQPWLESPTLAQVIAAEGPFPPRRMQRIATQIAAALDHAHHHAVLHGHLTAEQIYLGPDDHVQLTGFGLSQLVCGPNLAKHGLPGVSPETLAPERVRGQGPSRQADLYALGVLCYHMLAKQPPFHGPASTVLHAQAYRQPRPLHQLNPGLSLSLSETIGRMLAKSVEVRYHTGAEFVLALAAGSQPATARDFDHLRPLAEREGRRGGRLKALLYFPLALIVTVLVTALAIWAGYEVGLRQAGRVLPTAQVIVVTRPSAVSSDVTSPVEQIIRETAAPSPTVSSAATPESLVVLTDRLRPTATTLPPTGTPTATPASGLTNVSFNPTVAAPALPPDQGLFVFYNPTGYDLIVDLTGPTPASLVVPPGGQQEILLQPGDYQAILHTPTGNGLPSKVGLFSVAPGQPVSRDYYSENYETVE